MAGNPAGPKIARRSSAGGSVKIILMPGNSLEPS